MIKTIAAAYVAGVLYMFPNSYTVLAPIVSNGARTIAQMITTWM